MRAGVSRRLSFQTTAADLSALTAMGISGDGTVVVGHSSSAFGKEAFRWTEAEGMIGLGGLPAENKSEANAISADGSIVGRVRVDSDGIQAAPAALSGNRLLVLGAGGKLAFYQLEPIGDRF